MDGSGRRWLQPAGKLPKIPYDALPEVPVGDAVASAASTSPALSVAAAVPTPPATGGMAASTAPSAVASMSAPVPQTVATGSGVWDAVLPLDVLQNEIAAVRNDLNGHLVAVGSYNTGFEQVNLDGWQMSALATIAAEHGGPISWKDDALLARDAAVAVANAASGRGRENFNAAKTAFDQLVGVLNNNAPPDLGTPDPKASREETADRAALMKRMETAEKRLKEAAADEKSLAAKKDEARREAAVLAALAKFTAHPDYTSAAEADYQAAANEIVAAGPTLVATAEADDLRNFKAALDRVGTACANCHGKYRFGN